MREDILINVTPQETRVAVVASGVVQELHIERTQSRGMVGNIYVGKVARVLPGMQSAFIEIGLERAAFLHVADIWEQRQQGAEAEPIERILSEGQPLMVQVVKDPIGTKGARLVSRLPEVRGFTRDQASLCEDGRRVPTLIPRVELKMETTDEHR